MAAKVTKYFLGGNTSVGFYSLYDHFCKAEDGRFLWVIKGGPGCGKSTFMKKLADEARAAGLSAEVVLCSGDPDSWDGVWFPQLKLGYADGTAPHVLEPRYPGAGGRYVDFSGFLDRDALRGRLPEMIELNRSYKACYANAYGILAEAGVPVRETYRCSRRRFCRAITCRGLVSSSSTECSGRTWDEALQEPGSILLMHPLFPELAEGVLLADGTVCFNPEKQAADAAMAGVLPEAVPLLRQAKELHDQLEALYRPHVDFDAVGELTQKHLELLNREIYHCKMP